MKLNPDLSFILQIADYFEKKKSLEDTALRSISDSSLIPEDLHQAPFQLRLQQDDDEGNKDQVGVAEDIFQQQQLEVCQLVNTAARELKGGVMKNI